MGGIHLQGMKLSEYFSSCVNSCLLLEKKKFSLGSKVFPFRVDHFILKELSV